MMRDGEEGDIPPEFVEDLLKLEVIATLDLNA